MKTDNDLSNLDWTLSAVDPDLKELLYGSFSTANGFLAQTIAPASPMVLTQSTSSGPTGSQSPKSVNNIWVVAGNFNEYRRYRFEKVMTPNTDFFYVTNATSLRGQRNISGVFYGSWKDRKDIDELIRVLYVIQSGTEKVEGIRKAQLALDEYRSSIDNIIKGVSI